MTFSWARKWLRQSFRMQRDEWHCAKRLKGVCAPIAVLGHVSPQGWMGEVGTSLHPFLAAMLGNRTWMGSSPTVRLHLLCAL